MSADVRVSDEALGPCLSLGLLRALTIRDRPLLVVVVPMMLLVVVTCTGGIPMRLVRLDWPRGLGAGSPRP